MPYKRKRAPAKRKPARRAPRRKMYARPNKSLGYRRPAQFMFHRETMPSTKSLDILAAAGNQPAMGYLQFRLNMDSLVNTSDFSNLFANYRVTCIVTTLTPLFDGTIANLMQTGETGFDPIQTYSAQCIVTKVHGKYLNEPFQISTNGLTQREELAQIQAKTKTKMLKPRDIKLVTKYPATYTVGQADPDQPATQSVERGKSRWLSLQDDRDMEFVHNDTIFVERVDGRDVTSDFKFRVTHKVYFKCSYVG
jgi:hypothetical protein